MRFNVNMLTQTVEGEKDKRGKDFRETDGAHVAGILIVECNSNNKYFRLKKKVH